MDSISFYFWRSFRDTSWSSGSIEDNKTEGLDGSEYLLGCLNGDPSAYLNFAEEYYEEEIPVSPIKHVYNHTLLTQEIIDLLNSEVQLADIQKDLVEIGYPVDGEI